jgi:hypothetical protein
MSRKALFALVLATSFLGCEEQPAPDSAASAKPSPAAVPSVAAPAPTPSASAAPPPKPRDDCPEGSSGVGTREAPCVGSETSRMMEVQYSGKTTDQGPKFSVTNKSKLPILYGTIMAYFYDKAGKQLQVTSGDKPRPRQTCSGNIFAGQVKPGEKIWVFFSCVKKEDVPEGTATIEAEIKTVGFADASGEKNEFYWENKDLVPEDRPKGGIKPTKKK